jgi:hypothetical protein
MYVTKLQILAAEALRKNGMKATKENVNQVVASMRAVGIASSSKDMADVAEMAAASCGNFKGSSLLKSVRKEVVAEVKPAGCSCPRCGKPMVLAQLRTRPCSYCTSCYIALPFKSDEK